jgi:dihydroorotate dehydrogenase electron transfer subunit
MIATMKKISFIKKTNDMIILRLPWEHKEVYPAQFFMLGPESFENKDFILNRPFSVSEFDNDSLLFRIRVAGRFTAYLSSLKTGDNLRIIGPLGNFLSIEYFKNFTEIFLVAGGIGVAPLIFFSKWLEKNGIKTTLFFGIKDKNFLHYLPENMTEKVIIATEDGSFGHKGFVTDLVYEQAGENSLVIACGPNAMYSSIKNAGIKAKVHVLLEEKMACGFGVCLGCAVHTLDGYKRICREGPLFPLDYLTNL